ncbi:putative disease resistance protein [Sesamum angolense]|uniref:Disease resistance protein n=1 Tax=Sesamum angolense TaxID=2727404 RepID=A0AAE1X7F3_9LAMI|nr:putative disease resistance protein [Sesamum angolense]
MEKDKRVEQILDLSYNLLPYDLKSCFLYLGCFREDEHIEPENLYLLWMAEGMISVEDTEEGESLRDVAERYLFELANKCMVQVEMDECSIYNRFKSCRLHDLMRDLCLLKGKEEGFVEVVDRQRGRADESSICKTSRLAIHLDELDVDLAKGCRKIDPAEAPEYQRQSSERVAGICVQATLSSVVESAKASSIGRENLGRRSLSMIIACILNHQNQFRDIKLRIQRMCNVNKEKVGSTLLRRLLMCRKLSVLDIQCPVSKLPAYEVQLYQNVIELNLRDTRIDEDPMEILQKLPVLRNLGLLSNAYVGREIVCRATGFPQLKYLDLLGLPNLVEWRVEPGAMPNLLYLDITKCSKLEMIPDGLKFITTLRELFIYEMPEEFMKRVGVVDGEEGEDYHKIKHLPFIRIR